MAEAFSTVPAVGDPVTASWASSVGDNQVIVDTGGVTITPVANTQTTLAVTFNKVFPSTPAVFLQLETGVVAGATIFADVNPKSTTGFTLVVMASSATARNFRWLAILAH